VLSAEIEPENLGTLGLSFGQYNNLQSYKNPPSTELQHAVITLISENNQFCIYMQSLSV